ncbi:hypothetical protein O9K51_00553 [Purpureocillium lavendulum]|uniref:Uncharacterized protein n=1 Tax=Purpureocillium lavendulum TaxID=1247861 RepID=A0AB34G2Z8_9HYPO|nr:hypothetical protein O9K51_00553 [Purpureocillium lavendulum]
MVHEAKPVLDDVIKAEHYFMVGVSSAPDVFALWTRVTERVGVDVPVSSALQKCNKRKNQCQLNFANDDRTRYLSGSMPPYRWVDCETGQGVRDGLGHDHESMTMIIDRPACCCSLVHDPYTLLLPGHDADCLPTNSTVRGAWPPMLLLQHLDGRKSELPDEAHWSRGHLGHWHGRTNRIAVLERFLRANGADVRATSFTSEN